ncbi:hypothetical protein Cgig2_011363 [Carnegiea gigantea]|uniref:Glycosyl transferase 64 domain-containing protein n=1 Tax=Carnegiea gigantea TaxID=171969 RepID=A0A9Q1KU87_9CARY|nr:hypothetical protein Cgig2_011363 [Carnegiea gigantea]
MEVKPIFSLLYLFSLLFPTLSLRFLTSNSNPCDPKTLANLQSLRHDQLTVLINGYSELRIPHLRAIAGAYAASPFVADVAVLWGNPSTPAETLAALSRNLSLLYSAGAPVTVVAQGSNSLNSRFLPRRWIRTRGVVICDDDVEVDPKSVDFAFRIWQQNQDRLIGLFARSHDLDLIRKEWIYTVHPDRYSIVLTKFMILDVKYLHFYSCGVKGLEAKFGNLRDVVDNMHNCEDILMNFVVADISGWGPLLVGAERVRDRGDPRNEAVEGEGGEVVDPGLSGVKRSGGNHRKRRGQCIREFHKILERMSLRYSYGKDFQQEGRKKQGHARYKVISRDLHCLTFDH